MLQVLIRAGASRVPDAGEARPPGRSCRCRLPAALRPAGAERIDGGGGDRNRIRLRAAERASGAFREIQESGECMSLRNLAVSGEGFSGTCRKTDSEMLQTLLRHVLCTRKTTTARRCCVWRKKSFGNLDSDGDKHVGNVERRHDDALQLGQRLQSIVGMTAIAVSSTHIGMSR